jgi:hypothetical protein
MHPKSDRRRFLTIVAFVAWSCAAAAPSAAAPVLADSTALAGARAPADTTTAAATTVAAPADSLSRNAGARRARAGDIDADRLRFEGRTTPKRQFETRWPVTTLELPFASDAFARPVTLDAGMSLAGWRTHASDRTPVSGFPLFFGPANAATAIAGPGFAANDPFLVTTWETSAARPVMAGAAELLTRPRPVLWWEPAFRRGGGPAGATTSALLYEKGAYGDEQAGARFAAPSLGRGIAGAYTRRTSDGEGAFFRAIETRYALAVALPRVAGISGRIDGDLAWRRIEGAYSEFAGTLVAAGEALHDDRRLGLHLERQGGVWENGVDAEVARSSHTSIDPDSTRERWKEPSWRIVARTTWRPTPRWAWLADARVTGREFQSRVGPAPTPTGVLDEQFAATRDEARFGLGVRRASEGAGVSGARHSWSADLAYDGRAGDRGFLDARLGAAVTSSHGMAALDVESAHERATWEDRLTPSRDRYFDDVLVVAKPVRYSVAADPDLKPRRLNGGVARAEWRPGPSIAIAASASARYLADDFGWNLSRLETADSILVEERATWRGSGWVSHASLGVSLSWHSIGVHAIGWLRGGSSRLSPLAGAPPRAGADASIDGGTTLFRGDLPLRLGLDAHVLGEREAPIRAPAVTVVDASLRADFTDAGLFFRIDDVFDRRPPSGAYEISTDAGVPTMGRRFRFGVVWHLSD